MITPEPVCAAEPVPAPAYHLPPLAILTAPHPVLKAVARTVEPGDRELLADIVPRMFAAMYKAPGIGLAAPQVGYGLRLLVMDLKPNGNRDPRVLINPEVIWASEKMSVREEGCLSVPGVRADVVRPAEVLVRYLAMDGSSREIKGDGLLATCLQHEIDHFDGTLFIDKLSRLKRQMALKRAAKAEARDVRPEPQMRSKGTGGPHTVG